MKVLSIGYGRHLFTDNNPERARLELCAKAVGTLDLIVFTNRSDGLETLRTETGLNIHPTNSRTKLLMLFDAYKIAVRLIKAQPTETTINTQDPFETGLVGYLLKKKFGSKLIVQEHGDVFSLSYWRRESVLNQIRYKIGLFILKRADIVRAVSDRIENTLIKLGIESNKIRKLPVAIDVSSFLSASANHELRKFFGDNTFVFLSVARFVPQKNLSLMIRAFFQVYAKNNNVRLLLVGSGPEELNIKKVIDTEFNSLTGTVCPVKILPWSDDVAGLMAAADAYVLSSNYEGWARVLIEAVCMKLPVVTTDVGCANEVIKNGQQGLVVPVNDQEKLTIAMLTMAGNQKEYNQFKNNLDTLNIAKLPGTNLSDYGQLWSSTLR